jgi:hypothetical protein
MERVATQPAFEKFRPTELHLPPCEPWIMIQQIVKL